MIKATTKHVASFVLMMLLTVGFAVNSYAQLTYGPNVVLDGDFSGDTLSANWTPEVSGTATATVGVTEGALSFTEMSGASNPWEVQAFQGLTAEQIAVLAGGGDFELTFDARTTADSKTFHVFLGENGGNWARYWAAGGDGDVTVTNTMETYTLSTTVTETWDAMKLGFEVAADDSDLFIDNVQLRKVTENILLDAGFDGDTVSTNWTIVLDSGAGATVGVTDGALSFTEVTSSGTSFHMQAFQAMNAEQLDSIYAGPYEISFDARTDADEKTFVLFFGHNAADWENFTSSVNPTITNTMETYTYAVDVTDTWPEMKLGFEIGADAGTFYVDNVVLRRVREFTPEAPAFALSTENNVVTVSVTGQDDAAAYDVYFSDAAIDSADQAGVRLIGTLGGDAGLTLDHSTEAPHSSLAGDFTAHYAVIAKTEKGTQSDLTTDMITTGMTVAANYAVELSTDAVDAVFGALESGVVPDASVLAGFFPSSYVPFTVNESNKTIENGEGGDNDADISSKHWVGYDAVDNLLVIYAEILDDSIVYAGEAIGSGGAWNYDSWEMGLANYAPASFIQGSTHENFEGGDEPDWQFRGGLMSDRAPFIHANGGGNAFNGEIPNSQSIGETTDDGWRLLSVITTIELSGGESNDKAFDFPESDEIGLYPFNIAINDNDATARDTQIAWSENGGDDSWWNTPAKWKTIAFVGSSMVTSNEDDANGDNPVKFSLDQNYPNPFNPTTNISFTLANSSNVTLEVFNMLGQKVATLLTGDRMTAGQHTQAFDASSLASGMYVYRLSTPSFVQSRKMMLIK